MNELAPLVSQLETLTRVGGWVGTLTAITILIQAIANVALWRKMGQYQRDIVAILRERIAEQKAIVEAHNSQAELFTTLRRAVEIVAKRSTR